MSQPLNARCCWIDLAATDAARATSFYTQLFNWTAMERRANGGVFRVLLCDEREIGSIYQQPRDHVLGGAPSHWTPYIGVTDMECAVAQAVAFGGAVLVAPFVITGIARIALMQDAVGAAFGLWEPSK